MTTTVGAMARTKLRRLAVCANAKGPSVVAAQDGWSRVQFPQSWSGRVAVSISRQPEGSGSPQQNEAAGVVTSDMLTGAHDLRAALGIVADALCAAWNGKRLTLWVYDPQSHALALGAGSGIQPGAPSPPNIPSRPSVIQFQAALSSHQPVVLGMAQLRRFPDSPLTGAWLQLGLVQSLAAPLFSGDRAVGVAVASFQDDRQFTAAELRSIQSQANRAGAALGQAGFAPAAAGLAREVALLDRLNHEAGAGNGPIATLHAMADGLMEALQVDRASVWAYHPQHDAFELVAKAGIPTPEFENHPRLIEAQGTAQEYASGVCQSPIPNPSSEFRIWKRGAADLRAAGINTLVTVPLLHEGALIGLLSLLSRDNRSAVAVEDARLLGAAATVVAEFLHTVGLDSAETRATQQQETLVRIAQGALTARSTADGLAEAVRVTREALEALRVSLMIYSPDDRLLHPLAQAGQRLPGAEESFTVPLDGTSSGGVLAGGHARVMDIDEVRMAATSAGRNIALSLRSGGLLMAPVLHEGRPAGVLYCHLPHTTFASVSAIALTERIAGYLAPLLVAAQTTQTGQHSAGQQALRQLSGLIVSGRPLGAVMQAVVDALLDVVHADRVALWTYDEASGTIVFGAVAGLDDASLLGNFRLGADPGVGGRTALVNQRPVVLNRAAINADAMARPLLRLGIEASVLLPVLHDHRPIGLLAIAFRHAKQLDQAELETAETLANYAASAMSTAQTRELVERQAREQEALHRISSAFAAGRTVPDTLNIVARAALDAVAADRISIWRFRPGEDCFVLGAEAGAAPEGLPVPQRQEARGTVAAEALADRETKIVRRHPEFNGTPEAAALFDALHLSIMIVWPVIHENEPLGVICGSFSAAPRSLPAVQSLGETIANQAATALFVAEVNQRIQQRARELAILSDVTRVIGGGQQPHDLLHHVAETARAHLEADMLGLWVFADKGGPLRPVAMARNQTLQDIMGNAPPPVLMMADLGQQDSTALRGYQVIELDPRDETRVFSPALQERIRHAGLERIWIAPMYSGEEHLGVIIVGYRTAPDFAGTIGAILESAAPQIGSAVANAGLREQAERHARERTAIERINAAAAGPTPVAILQQVAEVALQTIDAVRATVWLYDASADGLYLGARAIAGGLEDGLDDTQFWLRADTSPAGQVLRGGCPIVLDRAGIERLNPQLSAMVRDAGLQAMIVAPISTGAEPLGALTVSFQRPITVDDPVVALTQAVATYAAAAVGRATALEDRRAAQERLEVISASSSDLTYSLLVPPDGQVRVEWTSDALELLSGWDAVSLEARGGWRSIIHPDDMPAFILRNERLRAGHISINEYRIITRRGETRIIEDRARPVWSEAERRVMHILGSGRDVTEQRRAEEAVRAIERVAPATLDALSALIAILDGRGRVVAVNRAWREHRPLLPQATLTPNIEIGANYLELCAQVAGAIGADALRVAEGVRSVLARQAEQFTLEYRSEAETGNPNTAAWFVVRVTPLEREDGRSAIVAHENISDRKRAEEALAHQALYDPLTGLPNRLLLFNRLQHLLTEAGSSDAGPALLVMDIDRFREVNDTFGHALGDVLLGLVADRVRRAVPDTHIVGRLGGDEFAVLVPADAPAGAAEQAATAMIAALRPPFVLDGLNFAVQASIGIAMYPQHGRDVQTLLRRADVAMYYAKRASSGYAAYSPDADRNEPHRLQLLADLRQAIEHDRLAMVYHPQVDLKTGEVDWVEALVRWPREGYGLVPPDEFVPLAEQTGLIFELTRWVVRRVVRQSASWRRRGLNVGIAVNFSARDLQRPGLPDYVIDCLRQFRVPANRFKVEITESSLIEDPDQVVRALNQLRKRGVRIVLDDFGMGYASLTHLKRLPVDELKIDKSFVHDLRAGGLDASIVKMTIELGHQMNATVVAEGVEDAETHHLLRELGCDAAQGFYLVEPVPADALEQWIRGHSRG